MMTISKYQKYKTIFLAMLVIIPFLYGQDLNVNRIMIPLTNIGTLGDNHSVTGTGAIWKEWETYPFNNNIVYDQGLWVTAKRNGAIGCTPVLWISSYSPGPIINGQSGIIANPQDADRYRVYKVTAGDFPEINPDVAAWPVDLGAPIDGSGKPKVLGDQMVWTVYNGADTNLYPQFFSRGYIPPRALLPIEIHQTVFEHFGENNDTTIWANSVFFEWAVYNKSVDQLDSVYLSLWSDVDFLGLYGNMPAVDTSTQTGYCWDTKDSSYGSVGYTLLYGPTIPSSIDTAIAFGKKKPGHKNSQLSSFWGIRDDSQDSDPFGPPWSMKTTWNVVRGLSKAGSQIIDSATLLPTTFLYSGDPISKTGTLWPRGINGGGAGFMMTTGPVTIAPGDSQWIMMALIPSVKLNGVDAVNRMRTNAQYLRSLPYDSLVTRKPRRSIPIKPLPTFTGPASFQLYKNYPNPFNAETIIPFDLPEISRVHIEIFDLLGRTVAVFPEKIFAKGSDQSVRWTPVSAAGVYFIHVKAVSLESASVWSGVNKAILLR